jgi:hypothetical protein
LELRARPLALHRLAGELSVGAPELSRALLDEELQAVADVRELVLGAGPLRHVDRDAHRADDLAVVAERFDVGLVHPADELDLVALADSSEGAAMNCDREEVLVGRPEVLREGESAQLVWIERERRKPRPRHRGDPQRRVRGPGNHGHVRLEQA